MPAARWSTSTPPPSGMWTSSKTTSGCASPMSRTASSTPEASPTTSTSGSSCARTPARKSSWSSTMRTRVMAAGDPRGSFPRAATRRLDSCAGRWKHQLDLGALPGPRRDARVPAVARHPPDDRFADAATIGRYGIRIEARTAIAHEDLEPVVARLRVDVHDRAAAELRRVDHRLTRRGHKRPGALVERSVADRDDLHTRAVVALDLARGRLERCADRGRAAGRGTTTQPRAQLALLPARKRLD